MTVTDTTDGRSIMVALTSAQRVELAAALDPGRRGLHVRLDNQAKTLATFQRERDEWKARAEQAEQLIPAYAMLDIWMALGRDSIHFDDWYDEHGYADAWAELTAAVREERGDLDAARENVEHYQAMFDATERERDAAVARAEQAENARDTVAARAAQLEKEVAKWRTATESAHSDFLQAAHDRDEWRARAEAAEARTAPAVTKAEIEKVLRESTNRVFQYGAYPHMADAVLTLLSGDDPAVFVVRESDLPEVQQDEDGWTDGTRHGWEGTPETAIECVETHLEWARFYAAVARAIEAEQDVDPVEELAGQIETATRAAIRQVCDDLAGVAPSLDPLTVEQAMEITAASRKVAAHVLGQEAKR